MMRRLDARSRFRRRGLSGVAFVYFSLIGLPVLFFGAGLATDFTHIIVANRQVTNAAQAAALAGAEQFAPDSASLDPSAATTAATQTYCYAQAAGEMSLSRPDGSTTSCPSSTGGSVSLTVTPVETASDDGTPTYTQVKVTAHFKVVGLTFSRLFGHDDAFSAADITRTASVCLPGEDGPTGGFCAAPSTS